MPRNTPTNYSTIHKILRNMGLAGNAKPKCQKSLKENFKCKVVLWWLGCLESFGQPTLWICQALAMRTVLSGTCLCSRVYWHGKLLCFTQSSTISKYKFMLDHLTRFLFDVKKIVDLRGSKTEPSLPCSKAKAKDMTRSIIRAWQ